MKLRVAGFLDDSLVNGEGLRTVVFVSGCGHNCPGCHNEDMQSHEYGEEIEVEELFTKIKENIIVRGVTFSGGEPMDQAEALSELAEKIKAIGLNLWCYTGYIYEDILNSEDEHRLKLLSHIDVLVDGPYVEGLKENAQKYTGSSNQRIIKLK